MDGNKSKKQTANPDSTVEDPWYKQFWPWFVFGLPASVVVAGIAMVYIAFKHADSTVSDDYLRDGFAVNKIHSQDKLASQQKLSAQLRFEPEMQELLLQLQGEAPPVVDESLEEVNDETGQQGQSAELVELSIAAAVINFPAQLRLELSHPVDASLDFFIDLNHLAQGQYHGEFEYLYMQRYYLRLLPMPDQQWRLQGEYDFKPHHQNYQLQLQHR